MSHRDARSRRRDRDPPTKRFDSRRVIKSSSSPRRTLPPYLESESRRLRCSRLGCLGCFSCALDALPEQCLRPRCAPVAPAVTSTGSVPRHTAVSVRGRRVPEPRSCSIGPRSRLWPTCSSLPCPWSRQLSSAATHVSNGMSTIRRNDTKPGAEHMRVPAQGSPVLVSSRRRDTSACFLLVLMSVSLPDPRRRPLARVAGLTRGRRSDLGCLGRAGWTVVAGLPQPGGLIHTEMWAGSRAWCTTPARSFRTESRSTVSFSRAANAATVDSAS
jgi:hypothetical protein